MPDATVPCSAAMAARKDAARPRRPRAAAPVPLTEAQLDEVRRAVLALSGTGARSLSKHGIVVYLDKELPLPQPSCRVPPAPIPAQEGAPNAATTRPDGVPGTSRQRRSRRRLQERLERREAAQVQERSAQPRGGGNGPACEVAAEATGGRAVAEAQLPPSPAATSPSAPVFVVPAMPQVQNGRPAFQFTGCRSVEARPWAAVAAQPSPRPTSRGSALLSAAVRPAGQAARAPTQRRGSETRPMQTTR